MQPQKWLQYLYFSSFSYSLIPINTLLSPKSPLNQDINYIYNSLAQKYFEDLFEFKKELD